MQDRFHGEPTIKSHYFTRKQGEPLLFVFSRPLLFIKRIIVGHFLIIPRWFANCNTEGLRATRSRLCVSQLLKPSINSCRGLCIIDTYPGQMLIFNVPRYHFLLFLPNGCLHFYIWDNESGAIVCVYLEFCFVCTEHEVFARG